METEAAVSQQKGMSGGQPLFSHLACPLIPALTYCPDAEAAGRTQRPAAPGVAQHLQAGGRRVHQQHPAPQPALEGQPRGGARQPRVPEAARVGAAEGAEYRAPAGLLRVARRLQPAQHQRQRARRQLHRSGHVARAAGTRSLSHRRARGPLSTGSWGTTRRTGGIGLLRAAPAAGGTGLRGRGRLCSAGQGWGGTRGLGLAAALTRASPNRGFPVPSYLVSLHTQPGLGAPCPALGVSLHFSAPVSPELPLPGWALTGLFQVLGEPRGPQRAKPP